MVLKNLHSFLSITSIQRISFRPDINGLRAIAVMGVVFYHAGFKFFQGGWLGVDIFFVISGFLISNIIISEFNNYKFSFKSFYIKRIKRIIPALISTLLISIPFSYWLLTPKAMIEYTKSLSASLLFYANYYFQNLDFYNAEPTKTMPLLHTWSLAIEEQFYILFPLLCFLLFKFSKKNLTIYFAILFLISVYLNSTTNQLIKFYQLQFRAWELLLGALIMILQNKISMKHIEKLGVLIIISSLIYFDDTMLTLNSIEPRIISNIGVALVLLSNQNSYITKLLSTKAFSLIGLSSYSIYLFHQPLFAFWRISKNRYELQDNIYNVLLIFVILLFFSYLNWKFVERVFQQKSFKSVLKFIGISLLIISIFIFFSNKSNGFANKYSYVPEEVLFYSTNPNIYPNNYDNSEYKFLNSKCNKKLSTTSYCTWFNNESDKNIFLIGDSHANALSVSFLIELETLKNDYNLIFLTNKLGRCLLSKQSDTAGDVDECGDETFDTFIKMLNKDRDIVVSIGRYNTWLTEKGLNEVKCRDCDYLEVFKNRLETISENSFHFYIIEPVPTYSFSIAESYLYKNNVWGVPITLELFDWEKKYERTSIFLDNLNKKNMSLVPTIPLFCETKQERKCYASTENDLYYSDSNHLTLKGAHKITNAFEAMINKK
jgi:peptidoglycan/LPS O-acetylase OafA/YrhL